MPKKLDQSHYTSQLKDVDAPDVVHLPMSKVSFLTIVDEYIHVICSKGAWYATTIFSSNLEVDPDGSRFRSQSIPLTKLFYLFLDNPDQMFAEIAKSKTSAS